MSLAKSLGGFVAPESSPVVAIPLPAKAITPPAKRAMGKRRDPEFFKLTVYVRDKTRKAVAIKLLQEGQGRQISELVEDLLDAWTARRSSV